MSDSKIHADLRRVLGAPRLAEGPETYPVIVQYGSYPSGFPISASSVKRELKSLNAVAHEATREQIADLDQDPGVTQIWLDKCFHTMLDVSAPLIGAAQVWSAGDTGQGIRVAIVDTGIDLTHPDLAKSLASGKDFSGKGSCVDGHGHGTHVAGIIAGNGSKYRGVAPGALLVIAKALDDQGSGSESDIIAGIEWAIEQRAQVINLSLGSDENGDGTDALSVACDAAVAHGVVVCAAAGNAGPDKGSLGSPACAKDVITIGATDKGDRIASFSSRGPTTDGRVKPDVCLPGVSIVSCRARGTLMGTPVDDHYTSASGTSMATPHAAGVCALLLAAKPDATPVQIKQLLIRSAKSLGLDANTQGAGRVCAYDAYALAVKPAPEPDPDPAPNPPPLPAGCTKADVAGALTAIQNALAKETRIPRSQIVAFQRALQAGVDKLTK